jgi:hypothetical protein
MKTLCRTEGEKTYFIITDVHTCYYDTLRSLNFIQVEDGFAKAFPAGSPHIDNNYQNFARYAEELILQAAGVHPVPWEQALLAFIARVKYRPDINWWLAGSTALAVRGLKVMPRDIDLILDDAGAHQVGELLLDCLIEPVQDSRGWISNWFGRAFLHARIEWVGSVDVNVDTPEISDLGPTAASRLETISLRGHEIRVPPLDLQLQVSERRGLAERVEKIKRAMEDKGS